MDSVSSEGASQADLKRGRRVRQSQQTDPQHRLPPHSLEAERGILGCIMLDPSKTLPASIVRLAAAGKEAFYDLRHQSIFDAMCQMFEFGNPVDLITLQEFLKNQETLEQVGGLAYISTLPDQVPSAANLEYYLSIVLDKHVLRKAMITCTNLVGRIYDYEGDVEAMMDEFERDCLRIRDGLKSEVIPSMRECVSKAITQIEDYVNRAGTIIGIPTGFTDLDKMTGGLEPGVHILAGRPSTGKTSLAMNIAEHVAVDSKLPVGVFELEMTRESLVLRMLCSRARVNLRGIREGYMAERDYPKITGTAGKLSAAQIWIEDTGGMSVMQLRARARQMVQQYGIKLFIVDYLQLLHATIEGKRIHNRQQEVAEISSGLKAMSKELNVPVIVLSQLSRLIAKEKSRKPTMADLRESGAIEQDADLIGLLYTPPKSEDDEPYSEATPVTLIIDKQRNGPTGEINLTFLKSYTRFESAAKINDADIPNDAQQTLV